ncbi:hypothetical protein LCGC14_0600770 [marine sediment metagenome]|uniref:Uncharacterized protein n=1 Tax=marine sediment metagenome TaxID=412755 RepID=A0A0F9TWN9_9ZZZZ
MSAGCYRYILGQSSTISLYILSNRCPRREIIGRDIYLSCPCANQKSCHTYFGLCGAGSACQPQLDIKAALGGDHDSTPRPQVR